MNNGFSNISGPTLNGLVDINANTVSTSIIATSAIVLNGVDVSTQLNQIPLNTTNITNLQQATTGLTYNATGDLTTIDNNVTISSTKILKSAYAATANEDVANKLYVDNKVAAIVDSAPATLDTLNELAAALGDDVNFSTTVTNSIATKASLTANQEISGTNLFSNISNTYYGSGANLTGVNSSTLTTSNMPVSGTFYPTFTNSATGASGLVPSSINQISYDRNNNRLVVPNVNIFGSLKMTSTNVGTRAIYNTFYSFMDTDATAGGTQRGTIYADSAFVYLTLNSGHKFMILIGDVNLFEIDSTTLNCSVPIRMTNTDWNKRQIYTTMYNIMDGDTSAGGTLSGKIFYANTYVYLDLDTGRKFQIRINNLNVFDADESKCTFLYPPICSTSCTTDTQLANKLYVDTKSSKLTTTQLPTTGTYYLPFLTSSVAGSGLTAYSDGNISYDRTNNRLHVPNLYSYGVADFLNPPTCSTNCSTSTQLANKAYVDSVIPSLTNYVTKDTNQIITGEKTFNGNLVLDAGFFGRNDAFAFNTYTGRMPIGYCGETITATTKPVSTVPLITDATIGLTKGVWQVTGYLWLSRGNGTFLANSRISVLYPVEAGLKIYPNSAGLSFLIPHTNTSTVPMVIPVGTLTIVCTGSGLPRQPVERTINMTVGTTTSWYITFSCVKIA